MPGYCSKHFVFIKFFYYSPQPYEVHGIIILSIKKLRHRERLGNLLCVIQLIQVKPNFESKEFRRQALDQRNTEPKDF